MISVTIATPDQALEAPWGELAGEPKNAFMNPVALKAAQDAMMAFITVLLAWEVGTEPAKLVGLWALQIKSLLPGLPGFLEALPYPYAFVSTPVVDPVHAHKVMPAFLAAIASSRKLPNVLWMQDMDAGSPAFEGLQKSIDDGKLEQLEIKSRLVPIATREAGIKTSGSTRKKLRQDWNRLSRLGTLEISNPRNEANVVAAMEVFLKLELAGWKGRRGTALLNNARDAAFTRQLIGSLAAQGAASVALLNVDGRPIAAQVLLYGGRTAYTWKPAFDEAFAAFSPGTLLIDRIATELLAGDVDMIDSCATEEGFMGRLWSGRKRSSSLLLNVAPGRSAGFVIEGVHRRGHEALRVMRDRLRRFAPAGGARVHRPVSGAERDTG